MIRFTTALALVTIAVAAPTAQAEPSFGSTVPLDPPIAAAIQMHRHNLGPLDPAIAAAIQTHRAEYGLHDLPLAAAVQAEPSVGPLDPAIATAIQMHHHNLGPLDPAIAAAIEERSSNADLQTAATSGFDWSDFAVGAGVMFVVVFALGSLLTIRSRQSARLSV